MPRRLIADAEPIEEAYYGDDGHVDVEKEFHQVGDGDNSSSPASPLYKAVSPPASPLYPLAPAGEPVSSLYSPAASPLYT